jgi:PLP dependent protein
MQIRASLASVRAEITAACRGCGRNPDEIRLIAVTKSQSRDVLPDLAEAGVRDFGENRVDHLEIMAAGAPADARFHHIGRIQSRQIPDIARLAACVHGLCQLDHAQRLAQACAAVGKRMPVFIQVNASGEASKSGIEPGALPVLLDALRSLADLDVLGLMTMAPLLEGGDEAIVRRCFARLRDLAHGHGLKRLSMGMSGDFSLAIAEGATDVRIGSRLFQ